MIYPKNNPVIFWFFKKYVQWRVGRQFYELIFEPIETDKNRSILLIANHYSFWDALILFCINERLFKKKPHVMVLEETMRKMRFLKYAGAFSVSKSSRSLLESVNYAATLLDDPGNLVLIFPQGKLYPNFTEHIHFEHGIRRIMEQAKGKFQLVFAASFIQYFEHPKPSVTVYLKTEIINPAGETPYHLQKAFQAYYSASKLLQTEAAIE